MSVFIETVSNSAPPCHDRPPGRYSGPWNGQGLKSRPARCTRCRFVSGIATKNRKYTRFTFYFHPLPLRLGHCYSIPHNIKPAIGFLSFRPFVFAGIFSAVSRY